ncbi:MAG: dihydroxy-acid dehydratase [Qingshengfaniella sp.]
MKLRSNFEKGSTLWALRLAQWTALGIAEADMDKPKIAVINASSELSSCYSHLDGVTATVKQAIRAAGGLPFEVKTTAPSDFIHCAGAAGGYILSSRDLMVNDIEVAVEGPQLDGMVCLASCDKTAPAQLMAAARLDIPTILVIGGYQARGVYKGAPVDIEDVFESVGKLGAGLDPEALGCMARGAIRSPGVCAGMGTANSMHLMAEALGMTIPGSAPVAANSERMFANAAAAGQRIVAMIAEDLRPSRIMTPEAFRNAATLALSLSCSINVMRHLQGVIEEARLDLDIYRVFAGLDGVVPVLAAIKPNGPDHIDDLDAAGGARAVLGRLRSLLDPAAVNCLGETLDEMLADGPEAGPGIATLDRPIAPGPSLSILRGTLAPAGAIMKLGASTSPDLVHEGPARVFEAQSAALEALGAGRIQPGDVVVLRGLGARGGPGVASASWFAAALAGSALAGKTALITDGQLSGLNRGIVVGQVMPEAATGGPIAAVRDGDRIRIDVAGRRLDLLIDADEMQARLEDMDPRLAAHEGWLGQYQRLVQSLDRGGVLIGVPPRDHD